MSISVDTINLRFNVKPDYDQQQLQQLQADLKQGQKKVQWYNKNRYGGYGRLIRRLTAGMSDAELQRIRGILNQTKRDFAEKSS